jgi:carboxylesterase 2
LTKKFFNNPGGPALEESEDCMYLNIYAPPDAAPGSKKAVMFWLHGVRYFPSKHKDTSLTLQGNLQFGSGSYQYFDGGSLAITQDVIVISINYRTNSMSTFYDGCPR